MQIDITDIARDLAPSDYSASMMELGDNAGKITWGAAVEDAPNALAHAFNREAFDAFFAGFGAWDDTELAAHSDAECSALMLQFIAGDIREAEFIDAEQFSDEWWQAYDLESHRGNVNSRLWRDDNGRIFYDIES